MAFNFEYLTYEVAEKSIYKTVKDGYEKNLFSIIKYNQQFYIESFGCSNRLYNLVIKETKRIFPQLKYLYE